MPENKFKVLVVDDEPEILDLLRYNFTKKGLEVSVALNGEAALEVIENNIPQVIVLDIMMPVMNGIELCRKLRTNDKYKNIPILFLSATNDDILILSAMDSGGDHFVSKPIRLSLLFEMVNDLHEEFKQKGMVE
ncbi:MAG: PleD family two-component system response regulator [Bacteroidia bacterium]